MSSAFRNFFITFIACLVVFGFLGFMFAYPWLTEVLDLTDINATESGDASQTGESEDVSQDVSGTVSEPPTFNANGDIFTALVMCESDNGEVLSCSFIDANGKTKNFVHCGIPAGTKMQNRFGDLVPISTLLSKQSTVSITDCAFALTGIETQYYISFDRAALKKAVQLMYNPSFYLNFDIKYINPIYKDLAFDAGALLPDDYYIFFPSGNITLDGSTLDALLAYNPNFDGTEYNAVFINICSSLLKQFFTSQEQYLKNAGVMTELVSAARTNLSGDSISAHLETIFSYDNFNVKEVSYPSSWEKGIKLIREADGLYE